MTKQFDPVLYPHPGETLAERAERHELYEEAVQNVKDEMLFLRGTFQSIRGRTPQTYREDFCGTASASCEWVRSGESCRAIGVDLDPEVLDWGRQNRLSKLNAEQQQRVELIEADVLSVQTEPVDMIGAFNFSYWTFQTRDTLRCYMQHARDGLSEDGLLIIDAYGGSEAYIESKEKTKYKSKGFTYVWHQAEFDPVSSHIDCHIQFRFADGSKIKKAFSYDWRVWTLPELRELFAEAGFKRSTVYWEGTDEDGDGNGEFSPVERGEADLAWIAYVVAEK